MIDIHRYSKGTLFPGMHKINQSDNISWHLLELQCVIAWYIMLDGAE